MTLTEFLLARIEEDEAETLRSAFLHAHGTHMAYRVRAECEAKRRIVQMDDTDTYSDAYVTAIRALAIVYADHPDYREEWKL